MHRVLGDDHWILGRVAPRWSRNLSRCTNRSFLPLFQLDVLGYVSLEGVPAGGPVVADDVADGVVVHQQHLRYKLRRHSMHLLEVDDLHADQVRQLPLPYLSVLAYRFP